MPGGLQPREPFLYVRKQGDRYAADGQLSCAFGHRIPRPGRSDDGVFAAWNWNGHTLKIENDRYGMYPLYYATWDGQIAVSRGITSLFDCGAPADLDYEALAVFLRLGFFLGEDTPFRAIRVLPPNAVFEWSAGALRLENGHWFPKLNNGFWRCAAAALSSELSSACQREDRPPTKIHSRQ